MCRLFFYTTNFTNITNFLHSSRLDYNELNEKESPVIPTFEKFDIMIVIHAKLKFV